MASVKDIDALLPQTQCGECGYPGCLPYAEAIAAGTAPIDRCPPGGVDTVKALAKRLDLDATPYLAAAQAATRPPSLAIIREAECIGCTKCISACPVDAIIGSAKKMHSVIAHECTGCGLCIEPCPVDCIEMQPLDGPIYDKSIAKTRYQAKNARLLHQEHEKQQRYREKRKLAQNTNETLDKKAKQDYILQALARVNKKRSDE